MSPRNLSTLGQLCGVNIFTGMPSHIPGEKSGI